MESRTRLAIGGMATVAASVTVICVVALTNSLALSESAGSRVDAAPVVVPASSQPSAEPSPTATPVATAKPTPTPEPVEQEAPADPAPSSPQAEVVPAPDAQVVVPISPTPVAETPAAPKPTAPAAPPTLEEALAQAAASGSWDPVRAWAASRGWTDERIQALIERLERAFADRREAGGDRSSRRDQSVAGSSDADRAQSPATGSDKKTWGAVTGSSRERPANAGAGARDWTERHGHGAKKDRSRDSPERRDR